MAFIGFTGGQDQLLDDKNRMAIPAKWREHFDAPAYLVSGEEPCIKVYTKAAFEVAAEEIMATPVSTKEGRDKRRAFFGSTHDVAKDSAGRLLVPQSLIRHASLQKNLKVIGVGECFEIWDLATWQAYNGTEGAE